MVAQPATVTAVRRCPQCGSLDVSRSRRRLLERILVFVKAFRCQNCSHRFRTLR